MVMLGERLNGNDCRATGSSSCPTSASTVRWYRLNCFALRTVIDASRSAPRPLLTFLSMPMLFCAVSHWRGFCGCGKV